MDYTVATLKKIIIIGIISYSLLGVCDQMVKTGLTHCRGTTFPVALVTTVQTGNNGSVFKQTNGQTKSIIYSSGISI